MKTDKRKREGNDKHEEQDGGHERQEKRTKSKCWHGNERTVRNEIGEEKSEQQSGGTENEICDVDDHDEQPIVGRQPDKETNVSDWTRYEPNKIVNM